MYDSVAPLRFPKASASLILNGRINADGSCQRRSGTIRTHPTALNAATGYGGVSFTTAAGVDQMIVFMGANAYKSTDKGATWAAALATGLREDYYSFATMRVGATNYLSAANGDTTIKRWDGTTWDTVPNAPSGVKFIAVFNGRLYGTGHSGVLVQASKIADPTVWASPDGLTLTVLTHAGDVPTGLYQVGPHLLVFDRRATSYIDGFGEQTIIVASGATGFSRSVGCVAFRSIVGVGDNGVVWLSERGVEYYTPSGGITLVSKAVQGFFEDLDWDQIYTNPGQVTAAYDDIAQDYHLAITTAGSRNNRTLVLNLREGSVEFQRPGPRASATVDRLLGTSGDLLFGEDSDGYLSSTGTNEVVPDANGYMSFVTTPTAGEPVSEDTDGYLTSAGSDALPASLFIAPATNKPTALYSVGYDGFVRRHFDAGSDDLTSASTGGRVVELTLRSRPFLLGRARQRKRVREIQVQSIQHGASTLTVLAREEGATTPEQTISIAATTSGLEESERRRVMTKLDADTPVVEVRSTDDVRVTMIGVSAELLRERVG